MNEAVLKIILVLLISRVTPFDIITFLPLFNPKSRGMKDKELMKIFGFEMLIRRISF